METHQKGNRFEVYRCKMNEERPINGAGSAVCHSCSLSDSTSSPCELTNTAKTDQSGDGRWTDLVYFRHQTDILYYWIEEIAKEQEAKIIKSKSNNHMHYSLPSMCGRVDLSWYLFCKCK